MKRVLFCVCILLFVGTLVFAGGQKQGGASAALTFLTWNYSDRWGSLDLWYQRVKEVHNIVIDMQNVPDSNYQSTLKARASANDLPDMLQTHGIAEFEKGLQTDYLEIDSDTFIDVSEISGVSRFNQDILEKRKINGKLFYVPVSITPVGVLYNKNVFSRLNLTIPTNYNEFLALMDKLKAAGVHPLAGSFAEAWSAQIIPMVGYSQFVESVDPLVAKKIFDPITNTSTKRWTSIGEPMYKALSFVTQWIDAGYFTPDPMGSDATVAAQMVATGKAAMFITGSWMISIMREAAPAGTEIGWFVLPLNEPGQPIYVPISADEGIVINSKSKNLEAAKQALAVYYTREIQEATVKELGGVPSHLDVVMDDPFINEVAASIAKNKAGEWFKHDGWGMGPIGTAFAADVELQSIAAGIITPQEFCERLDKAMAEAGAIIK
jgi:raffinose/stachyose/melibiose transport system substrate-binding protein